jgi:hypothetical protein
MKRLIIYKKKDESSNCPRRHYFELALSVFYEKTEYVEK